MSAVVAISLDDFFVQSLSGAKVTIVGRNGKFGLVDGFFTGSTCVSKQAILSFKLRIAI
jgi:hypothetical protein